MPSLPQAPCIVRNRAASPSWFGRNSPVNANGIGAPVVRQSSIVTAIPMTRGTADGVEATRRVAREAVNSHRDTEAVMVDRRICSCGIESGFWTQRANERRSIDGGSADAE